MSDHNMTKRLRIAIKRKIVPSWRSRISDFSTVALAAVSSMTGLWVSIPETLKHNLHPWVGQGLGYAILITGVWGLIGKFIVQGKVEDKGDQP